jgi:hypothetical protein
MRKGNSGLSRMADEVFDDDGKDKTNEEISHCREVGEIFDQSSVKMEERTQEKLERLRTGTPKGSAYVSGRDTARR